VTDQLKGTLITLLGVLILTPDAALTRLIDIGSLSMTFWRALGLVVVLAALAAIRPGGRGAVRQVAASGVVGAVLVGTFVVSQISFVAAIKLTNPAHVLVLISAAPLFGALASRLILGERLAPSTAITIAVGIAGIIVTASAGFTEHADWRGDLAALVCAACMGLNFTLIRRARLNDAWAHFAAAALINVAWIGLFVPVALPGGPDLFNLILLCAVIQPIAFALITVGPRYLTAPEVALLMLVEAPIGALIVWLVLAIAPAPHAYVGGAIVLATIAVHAWWRLRRAPAAPATAAAQKSVAIPWTSQSP
jgi:drug/metabolite transporter (DMT)-like permease